MLPPGMPDVHLIAHRGLATRFPENSVVALEQAADAGARIVEFDIQMSADGIPVVIHDETLERTTGCDGRVGDLSAIELGEISCGYEQRFGTQFADVKISPLSEVVRALLPRTSVSLIAELKSESIARFGCEPCLRAVLGALEPVRSRTVFISFAADAVLAAAAAAWPVGWCLERHDDAERERASALRPDLLLTDQKALRRTADLWDGNWRWASWEIVDPRRAVALMELGVDYVETMSCDRLFDDPQVAARLSRNGSHRRPG